MEDLDQVARRGVAALNDETQRANTERAYSKKIFAFFEHSDCTRGHLDEAQRHLVSEGNMKNFVWWCGFRAKQVGGKNSRRKRTDVDAACLHFPPSECEALVLQHRQCDLNRTAPPDPEEGVGCSDMEHCKNGLKKLHEEQVADSVNNIAWDLIWTLPCKNIMLMVKNRKARVAKANHHEKMGVNATPCLIVKRLGDIEEKMWMDGCGGNPNTVHCTLRNRFTCTRTTKAVARSETLHHEELSDHFFIEHTGRKDVHELEIDVSQVSQAKTTKACTNCSRTIRTKDVRLCPIGSFAMCLHHRFEHTKEFEPPNTPDFTDSSQWFDIKSLVALHDKESWTKGIADTNCSSCMKRVLVSLGLPTDFLLHLGRKVGAVELELKELDVFLLKILGNWNQSMFDKAHSAKIPLEALRVAADFLDGVFFCPRVSCRTATLDAIEETFWTWVELSLACIEQEHVSSRGEVKLFTAFAWLSCMKKLKSILVQDSAFMLEFHPERANHPFFKLPLFNTDLFKKHQHEMRKHCEEAVAPSDASLDSLLPGVLQHLRANQQTSNTILGSVRMVHSELRGIKADMRHRGMGLRTSFGRAFNAAGD